MRRTEGLPTPFSRKRFGQHFLEPAWVDKVVRAIDPKPDEVFVEIGPGRGALTRPLASHVNAVVAYEIDRNLAAQLATGAPPNVRVIQGDFLDAHLAVAAPRDPSLSLRAAGNLPYNVASPILFKLIDSQADGVLLRDATVMLQREVAARLLAEPGSRDYGILTVLIRHRATVTRLLDLPPGAFRPPPRVQSSVVRLEFHTADPPVKDPVVFAGLVQAVFTRRRKTLANALLAYRGRVPVLYGGRVPVPYGGRGPGVDALRQAGLDGRRRPETLTVAEFARLADAYVSISL